MLGSGDYFVREYAVSAIHKMPGLLSSTVTELCHFIDSESETALRSAAIRILSEKKIVDATDFLLSRVNGFDQLSRISAYEALGELGDPEHYERLFKNFSAEQDERVKSKIAVAIARLRFRNRNLKIPLEDLRTFFGDPDQRVRASACFFGVDNGDEAALMEFKKMLHDPSPRVVAAAAVSVFNAREVRVIDYLAEKIAGAEKPADRASYIFALRKMPDRRSSEILIGMLSDADSVVRRNAVTGLGTLREKSAIKTLIELYFHEISGCRENLSKIIAALRSIDNAETSATICREINKVGGDVHRRATLVKFLSHFAWENMANNFKAFLADEDPRVRANSIEGVLNLRERGVVSSEFVTKNVLLLTCDSSSRVVANAVKALYSCGSSGAVTVLREMMNSEYESARKAAGYVVKFMPAGIMEPAPALQSA